jgi:N,N'-diacetyllegionaminate synthase
MIEAIRSIEIALGDGIKELGPEELNNRVIVRKSIVANKKIKKGDVFDLSNIAIKRPGIGMSPVMWPNVIGLKAIRDFEINEMIEI